MDQFNDGAILDMTQEDIDDINFQLRNASIVDMVNSALFSEVLEELEMPIDDDVPLELYDSDIEIERLRLSEQLSNLNSISLSRGSNVELLSSKKVSDSSVPSKDSSIGRLNPDMSMMSTISTGYKSLDELLGGGFSQGKVVLIGDSSKRGLDFSANLLYNLGNASIPSLYVSNINIADTIRKKFLTIRCGNIDVNKKARPTEIEFLESIKKQILAYPVFFEQLVYGAKLDDLKESLTQKIKERKADDVRVIFVSNAHSFMQNQTPYNRDVFLSAIKYFAHINNMTILFNYDTTSVGESNLERFKTHGEDKFDYSLSLSLENERLRVSNVLSLGNSVCLNYDATTSKISQPYSLSK